MMNFSLAAALVLLGAKVTAAVITGSSAIYSDAAESVVHFLAVCFAVWALIEKTSLGATLRAGETAIYPLGIPLLEMSWAGLLAP